MAASNQLKQLLALTARTATVATADQGNRYHRGVRVHVEVTAAADTPSVVFTIQGKDAISGDYYTLLASAAVTGISENYYLVYPGGTAAANLVANLALPPVWRVNCVAADADSITYRVTAELLI